MHKEQSHGIFESMTGDRKAELLSMLKECQLEVFPSNTLKLKNKLAGGHPIAITCSPTHGIDGVIRLTRELQARNIEVIAHLAARSIYSLEQLSSINDETGRPRLEHAFIIGGDSEKAGDFRSALELLQAMNQAEMLPRTVGIAGYPESHPYISEEVLLETLHLKQEFARETDTKMYIVTQMCFDAQKIVDWIARIRQSGIELPVVAGIPGPCDILKLARFAKVCGVGDSSRLLSSKGSLTRQLTGRTLFGYDPENLITDLMKLGSESSHVSGIRLYTFNNIGESNKFLHRAQLELE